MTPDEHYSLLGRLVANLQSLEFIMRGFLHESAPRRPDGIPHGTDWYTFGVGTEVPLDEFTNWDTLGQLIEKFNMEMLRRGDPGLDKDALVTVRDALAHGRVSSASPEGDMRLLKFDKPGRGNRVVRVTFNQAMTREWFRDQTRAVGQAIRRVYEAMAEQAASDAAGTCATRERAGPC
jgi:hypothetical protein